MKPTVTIGVCIRNGEDSIQDTIEGIINQDFPHEHMEVIFVDDGSEDGTSFVILDSVSRMDMQVKVYHQEWKGLGATRNVVVNNAGGDYIVWVDDDVIMSKDYVRKQVEFMERNPTVGIAKGKYRLSFKGNLVSILEDVGRKMKYVDRNYEVEAQRSKSMGTAACIYRVEAIRQVGGFDENIKRAGEDWDAEYRIKAAGWKLYITKALFWDHERRWITWKNLWNKYFWRGHSLHYLLHKHRGIECLPEMLPPAAFFSGLFRSLTIYKLTRRKVVFLLPLQYTFKMTAWCLGFIKSHIDSYRHASEMWEFIFLRLHGWLN